VFYATSIIFLRLSHFFSKSVLTEIISGGQKKSVYTNMQRKLSTGVNLQVKGVSSKTKDDLLVSSLYLQKVTKYLHLVSMSDTTITKLNLGTNFLSLYQIFQNKLADVNYVLFFTNVNKYNVKPAVPFTFSNKENLFYDCVNSKQLAKTNYYTLDVNTLKSLPFSIQNEFKNVTKQNLNLGKENK
jgi:hypothetical protein